MARSRTELSDQIGKAIGCRQDFNEYNSNLTTEIAAAGSGAVTASISRTLRYYSFYASALTYPKNVYSVLTGSNWGRVVDSSIRDEPAIWHSTNHVIQNIAENDVLDVALTFDEPATTRSIEVSAYLAFPGDTGTAWTRASCSYPLSSVPVDRKYSLRIIANVTADAAASGFKIMLKPTRTLSLSGTNYAELFIIRHPAPAAL